MSFGVRRVLSVAAAVAAIGGLAWSTHAAGTPGPPGPVLLAWLALMFAARLFPVPWPVAPGRAHLSSLVDFAAFLACGAVPAAWLGLVARGSMGIRRLRPVSPARWQAAVLETASTVLAVLGSGLVLHALGGRAGMASGLPPLGALVGAGGVFLCLRTLPVVVGAGRPAAAARGHGLALFLASEGCMLVAAAFAASRGGNAAILACPLPLALAVFVHAEWRRAQRGHVEAVRTLASAVDAVDPVTRDQAVRVSKMCVQVARRLGLPESEVEELEYAALLHEVGRTAIQRDLLLKPGALSSQETAVMRTHPRLGSDIVRRFGFFPGAAPIVLAHHEQPDGDGYPQGLRGEDVPVGSRILMAVAAFDAMTSDRPYRRGLTPETAIARLQELSGRQFYPDVVLALVALHRSGALLDAFEPEVLERYAQGEGNSRLLEEHLQRRGRRPQASERPSDAIDAVDDGVPVLELSQPTGEDVVREDFPVGGGALLRVAARSDTGCVREHNEDSFGLFHGEREDRGCLLVVADGMGGAAAGEVASGLAVEHVRDNYFSTKSALSGREALHESMRLANELIHWRASAESSLGGMGTTCTAVAIFGGEIHVGHVGDSRAYFVRGESIETLTLDHTLDAELQRATGMSGPSGSKNVLTRCLGTQTELEVELSSPVRLQPGDTLVLCSDGLHNLITAAEIHAAVRDDVPHLACSRLVDLARQRGGPDNITVVVARVELS